MKFLTTIICLICLFSNCQNDPTNPTIAQGDWKVSYYFDNSKDETSNYNGYTFQFLSDGKFVAKFSGQTAHGTWSENSSSNKLIINISGNDRLDDLVDDWVIIEKNATVIKLKDDNTSKDEQLHFSKL